MNRTLAVFVFAFFAPALQAGEEVRKVAVPGVRKVTGQEAFATLKSLEGTWEGPMEGQDGPPGTVTYRVASNGSIVMETLFAGTPHEMISVYHMDGDRLVMTHYCAAGNQPRMRLDASRSTATSLVFAFDGGTNFDPKKDMHIHEGKLTLLPDGSLDSAWTAWVEGKASGTHRFLLKKKS